MCGAQCCTLSWPPTSQTVKLMFLYSTVSTLNPMVGMVVTTSPSLSLYKMVVLPAASNPTIRIRISFCTHTTHTHTQHRPPQATHTGGGREEDR